VTKYYIFIRASGLAQRRHLSEIFFSKYLDSYVAYAIMPAFFLGKIKITVLLPLFYLWNWIPSHLFPQIKKKEQCEQSLRVFSLKLTLFIYASPLLLSLLLLLFFLLLASVVVVVVSSRACKTSIPMYTVSILCGLRTRGFWFSWI